MTQVIELEQPEMAQEEKNPILLKVSEGLQAFNEKKKVVSDWAEKAATIEKPEDVNDKKAWEALSRQRIDGKNYRSGIQNDGKAIRKTIKENLTNLVSEKEKELVDIITPQEERLQGFENWRKSELERIEQERIEVENKRIQDRLDALSAFGYSIDYADLKAMSDDTFTQYLSAAKVQFEKEQAEKAEAERLQKEQEEAEIELQRRVHILIKEGFSYDGNCYYVSDFKRLDNGTIMMLSEYEFDDVIKSGKREIERLEKIKEAEQKRLESERAELEQLRKEQAERQAEIDAMAAELAAEKKRVADEAMAIETAKFESRQAQLYALGLLFNPKENAFIKDGLGCVAVLDIKTYDNVKWDSMLDKMRELDVQQKAEAQKQKEIEAAELEKKIQAERERIAEEARLTAIEDAKKAEQAKKDKEDADKKEAERQAALQPDKVKLSNYIISLQTVKCADLANENAKKLLANIEELLNKTYLYAADKMQSL